MTLVELSERIWQMQEEGISVVRPVDPEQMPHIVIARLQEEVARELWGDEN